MNFLIRNSVLGALTLTAGLSAQITPDVLVTSNISVSETWTSDNVYSLQNQIFVEPGATLTIEAGTVIASNVLATPAGFPASLVVTRGANINILGTERNPVIFTSVFDNGSHRTAASEWGNLTILGRGYISENNGATPGNIATPDPDNDALMEGLISSGSGQPAFNFAYGGGDDDDDSGTVRYCNLRYGGFGVPPVELNGISMGGIGRGTDMHHIEIYNNQDDGMEIWGGCVNVYYISMWNIGDDSFDLDQGWRGCAQFIFVVQGGSDLAGGRESGVSDRGFEMDGAESETWQPFTNTRVRNATVVMDPINAQEALGFRDGVVGQFRECIFVGGIQQLLDDDGSAAYDLDGAGGSSATDWFYEHWTDQPSVAGGVVAYNDPRRIGAGSVNGTAFAVTGSFYKAQVDGNMCEIEDSAIDASFQDSNSDRAGVTVAGGSNGGRLGENRVYASGTLLNSVTFTPEPGSVTPFQRCTSIDPRPRLAAVAGGPVGRPVSVGSNDSGRFRSVNFRGAFDPLTALWLNGWSTSFEYGLLVNPAGQSAWIDVGNGIGNPIRGEMTAIPDAPLTNGSTFSISMQGGTPFSSIAIGLSVGVNGGPGRNPDIKRAGSALTTFGGWVIDTFGDDGSVFNLVLPFGAADGAGASPGLTGPWGTFIGPFSEAQVYWQWLGFDFASPTGIGYSNGIMGEDQG